MNRIIGPNEGTESGRRLIGLEQGWSFLQTGITKVRNLTEEEHGEPLTSEFYINMYTTVYNMCTQKPPHDYSAELYKRYKLTFEEYITAQVLPKLRGKLDEPLLRELGKRWNNYEIMKHWLSRIFNYLDRLYIPRRQSRKQSRKQSRRQSSDLVRVSLMCFRDQVYVEVKDSVKDAMISLIDRERDGEEIDRDLLKRVIEIFVTMGMDSIHVYKKDFEIPMLKDTAAYYSSKAEVWKGEYSNQEYMLKVEDCLKREKERVGHYLHPTTEELLLKKVRDGLLPEIESEKSDAPVIDIFENASF